MFKFSANIYYVLETMSGTKDTRVKVFLLKWVTILKYASFIMKMLFHYIYYKQVDRERGKKRLQGLPYTGAVGKGLLGLAFSLCYY